jgi:hypothetical protein
MFMGSSCMGEGLRVSGGSARAARPIDKHGSQLLQDGYTRPMWRLAGAAGPALLLNLIL